MINPYCFSHVVTQLKWLLVSNSSSTVLYYYIFLRTRMDFWSICWYCVRVVCWVHAYTRVTPLEMASGKIGHYERERRTFHFLFRVSNSCTSWTFSEYYLRPIHSEVLPNCNKNMCCQHCKEACLVGKAIDIPVSSNSNNNEGSTVL